MGNDAERPAIERRPQDGMAEAGADAESSAVTTNLAAAEQEIDDLRFTLIRCSLYHRARIAWFGMLHRCGLFVTIMASTGAVAAITGNHQGLARGISLLAAAITAVNLAFDFSGRARKHEECRATYHALAARLETEPHQITALNAEFIIAAGNEPVTFEAADRIAFNKAIRSMGRDRSEEFVLTSMQFLLRHLWPYNGTDFPQRKDLPINS